MVFATQCILAGQLAPETVSAGRHLDAETRLGGLWQRQDDRLTSDSRLQTRSFVYDSLSRLTSETHPESGTTTYTYNSDSLMATRKDARNVTTTFNYDTIHRLTSKTYSDTTPSSSYVYDSTAVSNGKGRRTSMSDATGSSTWHFDAMGRVTKFIRTANNVTLTQDYTYNLIGGVRGIVTPEVTGGTWDYTFDNAGRQDSLLLAGWLGIVNDYTFTYSATGATEQTFFANTTTETITYDARLQPVERRVTNPGVLMELDYLFKRPGDNKNNGNVWDVRDRVNSSRDQVFDYGFYNRLKSFWWPGASTKTYSYDRYGNHTGLGFGVSSTTNRITGTGYTWDAAGNMTARPGNSTFQWDGEGRLKSVNNGAVATNSYDGDGKRSVKTSNTETRLYFYDVFGNPFLESAPTQGSWLNAYVYFNGRHVWQNTTNGHFWRHADMLGTPRLRTTGTGGSLCGTYTEPFGGELSTCTTQPSSLDNYKFTDKERDVETGLDNFGARMYGFPQARFLSVDPARESFDPQNPQTWNRYTYVLNNPLKFVDPDGRIAFGAIKLGVKLLLKGGDIAATTAGIVEDTRTLADPNASAGEKAFALFSLATEIFSPVSARDVKFGTTALGFADEATDAARVGFDSFSSLKRALGPAGDGKQWHHIVEQSKVGQFGSQAIHNADNVVSIPTDVHRQISAFYSSKQPFTGGQTVREWLSGLSFEQQRTFGEQILRDFGVGQ